ncbi:histone H1-like [Mercurialis annua]|uniref:histone H1-like n=1 Tax=Mercurialis annua TaxID=3986 RepID=UPI00215F79EA|nr:histone H1-like [Mercurialis annua]
MAKGTVSAKNKPTKMSPPSPIDHPPYFEMISEAILTLKERTGSSQPAIAKFMEENYKDGLPQNFKKLLSVQLKKFVKSDRLDKVKNSYKIASAEKLKLAVKEKEKSKKSASVSPKEKMKRLSQVKTPDVLKKSKNKKDGKSAKMKRLSQVKTPDVLKKKQNSKAKVNKK